MCVCVCVCGMCDVGLQLCSAEGAASLSPRLIVLCNSLQAFVLKPFAAPPAFMQGITAPHQMVHQMVHQMARAHLRALNTTRAKARNSASFQRL